MPRYLFDIEARAVGRQPLHHTRKLDANDALDAINRAACAMPAAGWGDADITSLTVSVDLLTEEPKP